MKMTAQELVSRLTKKNALVTYTDDPTKYINIQYIAPQYLLFVDSKRIISLDVNGVDIEFLDIDGFVEFGCELDTLVDVLLYEKSEL